MINIREFLNLNFYTSIVDLFLNEFDKKHTKLSASQRAEQEKYARIYQLRDHPQPTTSDKTRFWNQF